MANPEPDERTPDRKRDRVDRARLDAIFGTVLPEQTSDERSRDGAFTSGGQDEWLRRQVPPHHG
ncbi:hypothetical protein [Rhodococcus sp. SGAir0479]|uniref:hypothetical protein n=1 Tax=Rhodococcus sp. SGAir0479 TaxID=2567884 RepID=UPI0010CD52AB|nr:hypothetical protein [Rhodococcus sp. SGAir0479]QCQ90072.1 hypothetical protein E7742_01835 [Rhodococcus sp. SGAir0479]